MRVFQQFLNDDAFIPVPFVVNFFKELSKAFEHINILHQQLPV